jgi:ribose transport system permease protein
MRSTYLTIMASVTYAPEGVQERARMAAQSFDLGDDMSGAAERQTATGAAMPDIRTGRELDGAERRTRGYMRALAALSPRNVSIVYIVGAFMILLAFWVPNLFYTQSMLKALLYEQAVTGIAALAFLIPYTTLNFDLTVGALVGVGAITAPWLIVNAHVPIVPAILITLVFCALIGAVTGLLTAVLKINSMISTVAMLFVIDALGGAANNGTQVLGLPSSYTDIASHELFGIALPFYYLIILGIVLWFVLTQMPVGRYLYAAGGSQEAARLAGVRVTRLVFGSFVASALIAGAAGILVSSRVGTGDFSVGSDYLFPAASAIFLGATQVKRGVFNVWGSILAVYGLGVIVQGLELGGAPYWVSDLMNGVALIAAVALGNAKLWRRPRPQGAAPPARPEQLAGKSMTA